MKIAVFLPNWVGDVVMATPMLRALREHHGKQARIVGVMRPHVAQVLAGLQDVDYVTVFAEATPLALIRAVRPDVLVKGADYRKEEVVGREIVEARGGRSGRRSRSPTAASTCSTPATCSTSTRPGRRPTA